MQREGYDCLDKIINMYKGGKRKTHKKNWACVYVTIVQLSKSILVFGDMTDCPKYPVQELPHAIFFLCHETEP